jgi:hypothetical protein
VTCRRLCFCLLVLLALPAGPVQANMPVEYGATIALNTAPRAAGTATNTTAANFQAEVDDLAAHGQQWIRLGVDEGEALDENASTATTLVWQQARLLQLDADYAYVHQHGMKLLLLVGAPTGFTTNYSQSDYLKVVADYFTFVSQRWSTDVDAWETWNESNLGDFRLRPGYVIGPMAPGAPMPTLTTGYLNELSLALQTARTAIRTHSAAPTMTSVGEGYALYNQAAQDGFIAFHDAISGQVDALDVHMYDAMDPSTADISINYLTTAYSLSQDSPIAVSERAGCA